MTNDEITFEHAVDNRTIVFTKENISLQPTGFAYAYPSKESFLSRPLDAYSAWMEWKQTKEKEFNKVTSFIAPVSKWWELKVVAKFHTNEEAQQAVEVVRECLETFHKDHTNNESKSE